MLCVTVIMPIATRELLTDLIIIFQLACKNAAKRMRTKIDIWLILNIFLKKHILCVMNLFMTQKIVSHILNLLQTKGVDIQYGNEDVTQLEHALQCAELAEQKEFSNELITAALLHDIGHLLYDGKDPIYKGVDGHHENLGANYLSEYFGEEVIRPIGAHVDSKRYLSRVDENYYNLLSEASKISLIAQGGPFTKEEAEEFIKKPFMKEAVELRRLDDLSKILNKKTPDIFHFRQYVEQSLKK